MNMNENQGLMLKVKHCFDVLDSLFTLKWENLCAKQFSGCFRKSESFKMCLYLGSNDGIQLSWSLTLHVTYLTAQESFSRPEETLSALCTLNKVHGSLESFPKAHGSFCFSFLLMILEDKIYTSISMNCNTVLC